MPQTFLVLQEFMGVSFCIARNNECSAGLLAAACWGRVQYQGPLLTVLWTCDQDTPNCRRGASLSPLLMYALSELQNVIQEGRLEWRFLEGKIEAESMLDGYYVIVTDTSPETLDSMEVAA